MSSKDSHEYDLCVAVNYYSPYVSGLTEVARVLAEGLAGRGWRVAVVAVRHDPTLPLRESRNGVDVYRSPVVASIGRGPVSPGFPALVRRLPDVRGWSTCICPCWRER